jgi:hypothetical protein
MDDQKYSAEGKFRTSETMIKKQLIYVIVSSLCFMSRFRNRGVIVILVKVILEFEKRMLCFVILFIIRVKSKLMVKKTGNSTHELIRTFSFYASYDSVAKRDPHRTGV